MWLLITRNYWPEGSGWHKLWVITPNLKGVYSLARIIHCWNNTKWETLFSDVQEFTKHISCSVFSSNYLNSTSTEREMKIKPKNNDNLKKVTGGALKPTKYEKLLGMNNCWKYRYYIDFKILKLLLKIIYMIKNYTFLTLGF